MRLFIFLLLVKVIFLILNPFRWLVLLCSFFCAIAASIYLIVDTQLIIGNRWSSFDIDDYIVGAMCLYIDILRIFLEILRIIAILRGN